MPCEVRRTRCLVTSGTIPGRQQLQYVMCLFRRRRDEVFVKMAQLC